MLKCPRCGTENRDAARYCNTCASPLASQAPLPTGTLVHGRYTVASILCQGARGRVYLVNDNPTGRPQALKELFTAHLLPADAAQAAQSFEKKASTLASLSHPNLPHIDVPFTEGGRQYLVMEYVDGETLEATLRGAKGFLPEADVVKWAVQVCEVLECLHGLKPPFIFHDLKPANVMLAKDGKVKLIGFGLARLFDLARAADTLKLGTVGYAPPEQYAGPGKTDARSDVYALGATLHHLLTRRDPSALPFAFPNCKLVNPALSDRVCDVVSLATELDPAKRYATAREARAALLGKAPPTPPSPSGPGREVEDTHVIAWPPGPLRTFQALCIRCKRETTWFQERVSHCTCSGCARRVATGRISRTFEASCKVCRTRTAWVSGKSTTCLGCGEQYFRFAVVGTFTAHCANCSDTTSWAVGAGAMRCLACGRRLPFYAVSGSVDAHCSRCQTTTEWLVYYASPADQHNDRRSRLCLECGRVRT
jgi:hypothetical protein